MKNISIAIFILFFLSGCSWMPHKAKDITLRKINSQLPYQETIYSKNMFWEIILELDSKDAIRWKEDDHVKTRAHLLTKFSDFPQYSGQTYTQYALQILRQIRGFSSSEINYFYGPWPKSPNGKTSSPLTSAPQTGTKTSVNTFAFRKPSVDKFDVINFLVHERVHSVGDIHLIQKRKSEECGLSYLAGDLAHVLAVDEAVKNSEITCGEYQSPMCESLIDVANRKGLLHQCS